MTSIALSTGLVLHFCYSSIVLTATYHPALLYYDYMLTFGRERRLFWSQRRVKQWGPVLFFANRYCGVVGHVPVIIQMIPRPKSTAYLFCKPEYLYHEILVFVMQTIIGCTSLRVADTFHVFRRLCLPLNSCLYREDLRLVR